MSENVMRDHTIIHLHKITFNIYIYVCVYKYVVEIILSNLETVLPARGIDHLKKKKKPQHPL